VRSGGKSDLYSTTVQYRGARCDGALLCNDTILAFWRFPAVPYHYCPYFRSKDQPNEYLKKSVSKVIKYGALSHE